MISNPRTNQERLLWAYQFGHAWNRDPKYDNLRNLDTGRILTMTGEEEDAKLLLASWQDFEPNVQRLVEAFYGRELQPDGDIGPASQLAMDIKRCAMPDFAPPPGAELAVMYDNEELRGAIESYQRYAQYRNDDREFSGTEGSWPESQMGESEYTGGSGSWPKGCDPEFPNVHSVRVNVGTTGASSHQKEQMKEVLAAVEACEAAMGQHVRHILDGDVSSAEHDVRFQYIAGGVIGFNYFPQPGKCQQKLVGRLDNSFNVAPKTMSELCVHEYKGHGDGLEHRSRTSSKPSIMHPSISTPSNFPSWIGDAHEASKRRYFGGVPIPGGPTPGPGPDPGPQPGPDVTVWEGTLAAGAYRLIRKGTGTGPMPPIQV
jgi:hypothetical protein